MLFQLLFIGIAAQIATLLLGPLPEIPEKQKIRFLVLERLVGLVGLLLFIAGAFARVLHRQGGDDHQHFAQHFFLGAGRHHPRQGGIQRKARQLTAERGDPALLVERAELFQQAIAVPYQATVRRFYKGEVLHRAQLQVGHAQNHRAQIGALDFRIGERRPIVEIVLVVEPVGDAGHDPAAAPGALVGAGAGDRLHRQTLHLGVHAVAADAGGTGVDHIADARHGQRGFRHVGAQHHAPPAVAGKHPLLLRGAQAGVQRQQFGIAEIAAFQMMMHVADLALAAQEHQHITGRRRPVAALLLIDFAQHLLHLQAQLALFRRRPVVDVHREGAPGHLEHRRAVEMGGEAFMVDGRRGDDDFQVRAARQQLLQIAEQKIDVQAALVGLVDDQGVVLMEVAVLLDFAEQHAVGHQLDQGVVTNLLTEADLVTHQAADLAVQLLGDARGNRASGQTARLGVADIAVHAAPQGQTDLGQLGGLAGAGFAGHHHHLVLLDGGGQFLAVVHHRQVRPAQRRRRQAGTPDTGRHRGVDGGTHLGQRVGVELARQPVEPLFKPPPVGGPNIFQPPIQFIQLRVRHTLLSVPSSQARPLTLKPSPSSVR